MTVSDYKNQQSDDSDGEQQGFYAGGSQNSGNMILGECWQFACFVERDELSTFKVV